MKRSSRVSRRRFVGTSLGLPAAGAALAQSPQPLHAASRFSTASVYQRLGVRPFINAYGTSTPLSGTLMAPEVTKAMVEASHNFVMLDDLQEKVGKRLAELTGAEAAFVTTGASAALCLATCAVTAGDDPEKMKRLPDLTGMKSEIVIQKAHRNPNDHAFRMVGVKLIEAETADEIRRAITNKTAAVAMVLSHNSLGHQVKLEQMIAIAHQAGVPLILDAAAEIPPPENLKRFVPMGADLVAFSGGKNLRGPQPSGILTGRKDLIAKAYANSCPRDYFARIAKVGKEEIIGLLAAVELYLSQDHAAQRREYHAKLNRISEHLRGVPTLFTELAPNDDYSHSPRLCIQWDEAKLGVTLDQMMSRLWEGEPAIYATDMRKYRPHWKGLGIFPYNLLPGEEMIIARRVRRILTPAG